LIAFNGTRSPHFSPQFLWNLIEKEADDEQGSLAGDSRDDHLLHLPVDRIQHARLTTIPRKSLSMRRDREGGFPGPYLTLNRKIKQIQLLRIVPRNEKMEVWAKAAAGATVYSYCPER
jgi:hypothetical protein